MTEKCINWGFSTIGCPELTLKEAAAIGEEFGFPMLEIRLPVPEKNDTNVIRRLAEAGRCQILGSSFALAADDDDARKAVACELELAAECHVPYLRCFGGFPFSEEPDQRKLDAVRKNLDFVTSLQLPVRLALETHDGFSSASRVARLFAETGIKLPVIWDSFHTFFKGGEGLQQSYGLLKGTVIDVHIKDGSEYGFTLPGCGRFPLNELFQLLLQENYTGLLTCEHEKMWHPELPMLTDALTALKPFQKLFKTEERKS